MSTLAIIQCRYGSTRFPGKALEDFFGRPIIEHVVNRARAIVGVDQVMLAIPMEPLADHLIDWATKHSVEYIAVRGNPMDVLKRFARVIEYAPEADIIMRLTGDCPLIEPTLCHRLLLNWLKSGCEYGWLDTHTGLWPDGLDCEVFWRGQLLNAYERATDASDREHVTSWIRRNATVYSLPQDTTYDGWPKVSIDTPEDLERVRRWIQPY